MNNSTRIYGLADDLSDCLFITSGLMKGIVYIYNITFFILSINDTIEKSAC